jgi:hypothetical protein
LLAPSAATYGNIRRHIRTPRACSREDSVKKIAIALLLGAVFAMGGCGDEKAKGDAKSGDAKSDTKADSAGGTGLAECDAHIKKLEECAKKDGPAKATFETTLKTTKEAYKTSITDASKEAMKTSCKAAADATTCP